MMPREIIFSVQVSSFTHENRLKTRNFKPVCGKERKMEIDVTVVPVKKPRISLVRPAQVADVHHSRGKKNRITLDGNL